MPDLTPTPGASPQVIAMVVFLCNTVGVVLRWFESITRHVEERPLTRRFVGRGSLPRGLSAPRFAEPGARCPVRVTQGCDLRGCRCRMGKARAGLDWNLGSVRNPCGRLRASGIPRPVFGGGRIGWMSGGTDASGLDHSCRCSSVHGWPCSLVPVCALACSIGLSVLSMSYAGGADRRRPRERRRLHRPAGARPRDAARMVPPKRRRPGLARHRAKATLGVCPTRRCSMTRTRSSPRCAPSR
jgi:hypothetical protein